MDEILKKLEGIENKIGDIRTRLEKVENFSIKLGQKVVEMQTKMTSIQGVPSATVEIPASVVPHPTTIPLTTTSNVQASSSNGFESYFGQWILGIVGLISVIFGISFFLKFAFDNNWIPVTARVLLGLLAGLGFIVGGEFMRKNQAKFANILSATGLGLLYI